ncbi:hypothetical protein SGL43_03243 [Streptomyces globisporus]|uniref:Uncharacterized protein n=1 Tax=Streptomyces globisporus TaxID=1908 RepID=A0ABN8V149_STRGL|nr:DUF6152 family protein [Streptomyces globisporus]CAH9416220.1 hypothetical protein SGL43_03243 [Streptomyces globisporus]
MRPFTTAIPLARRRRTGLATASLLSATLLLAYSAGTAQAHHGFDDFDTDRLYYIAGTVSEVRWGEPHSYFTVTVEDDLPDDTPEHDLPDGLRDAADSDPVTAAPSYEGSHDELAVTIAPPSFTSMWGLDRELDDGERVEAVGYIGKSHNDEFRPVVFWVDGQPVNQVLNEELPAQPLPVPYPQGDEPSSGTDQDAPSASADSDGGTSPVAVWGTLGAITVAVITGGAFYLRARSRRT